MSAKGVWRAIVVLLVLGIVALLILAWMWREGRLAGVATTEPAPGAIASYSGLIPTGGGERLKAPRALHIAGNRLYVVEPDASRVSVFSLTGRLLSRVSIKAADRVYPVDVAVFGETMYVIDTAGRRVLALPARGGASRRIAEKLQSPGALAMDGKTLLIADAVTGLWEFDPETGALERSKAGLKRPGFIGGIVVTPNEYYLSQTSGGRILSVLRNGSGATVFGDRVNLPRGIARDQAGRIWVSDVLAGEVLALSPDGQLLGNLEDEPVISGVPAEVTTPQGIAYSKDGSRLFVAEADSGRVLVYTIAR